MSGRSDSHWIIIEGRGFRPGVPPYPTRRIGPFASAQEAEAALPDHLPWDTDTYVYNVYIDATESDCDTAAPKM